MSFEYDLLVIGAGSGGVRAARMAATYGAKVVVVEEDRVGGTCVIRGCVPKKLFVYASRFADMFEIAPSFGWTVDASFDWPTLVANKDKEIARLEAAYVAAVERPGGTLLRDRAVLTGPNGARLERSGREITARYILVATGGHPHVPDIPGKELGITSNEAFDLKALPLDPDRGRRLHRRGVRDRLRRPGRADNHGLSRRQGAARLRRRPAHRT